MALVKAVSASEGMASIGAGGVEDAAGGGVVAVIRAPAEVVTTAPAPGGALVEGGTPGAVVPEEAMISDTRCYVAAGDRGRWIGIEGAAADGVNSTRGYCSQGGGCESERGG